MGSVKIKKMMKHINDALTAASFAEEDQDVLARSMLNDGRRVLVALKEGAVDTKTLKYAHNSAKRINAAIDILYVSAKSNGTADVDRDVAAFEAELKAEGIRCQLVRRSGCLKQQIIDYTNSEKEILFAVVESSDSLDLECDRKDSVLSELWRKLKCPLVVVMDEAKG